MYWHSLPRYRGTVFFLLLALALVSSAFLLVPRPARSPQGQANGDVEELLYAALRNDGYIKHPNIKVEIHVKAITGRKLHDVVLKRKAADGNGFDVIAVAKEAELRVDMAQRQMLVDMLQCQVMQGNGVGFMESKIWPVPIPEKLAMPIRVTAVAR